LLCEIGEMKKGEIETQHTQLISRKEKGKTRIRTISPRTPLKKKKESIVNLGKERGKWLPRQKERGKGRAFPISVSENKDIFTIPVRKKKKKKAKQEVSAGKKVEEALK